MVLKPGADAMARARRDCAGHVSVDCQYPDVSLVLEQENPSRTAIDSANSSRACRGKLRSLEMIPRPAQYFLRFDDSVLRCRAEAGTDLLC